LGYNADIDNAASPLVTVGLPYAVADGPEHYYFPLSGRRTSRKIIRAHAWDSEDNYDPSIALPARGEIPSWIRATFTDGRYGRPEGSERTAQSFNALMNGRWDRHAVAGEHGVGLVFFDGHGSTSGNEWSRFHYNAVSDGRGLANGVCTPVLLSMCCDTGWFAHPVREECLAEAFLRHTNGGAVGVVASSWGSDGTYSTAMTYGFFSSLFGKAFDPGALIETGVTRSPAVALLCGKATMRARTMREEGRRYKDAICERTWRSYHWFGDPEMTLRTRKPDHLRAACLPERITQPQGLVPIGVAVTTDQGDPVSCARVAMTHPNLSMNWVGLTDGAGQCVLKIDFGGMRQVDKCGAYDLVVTHPDACPIESYITVAWL
jgi:hypothetical protein